jgi:hypothetical protein
VTYFLVTFEGFFCSLLYCFLNTEVRETISRRLRGTPIWMIWKRCLGKEDPYKDGPMNSEDRTRLELLVPHSTSATVRFFYVKK